jgi:uncharacterized RDD family membrane protein YckC
VNLALPAEARAIQRKAAGLVSRASAGAIDLAFVTLLVGGAVVVRSVWRYFFGGAEILELRWPSQVGLASLGGVLLFLYLTWSWASTGRTVGKRILGLAVMTNRGGRLSWPIAAIRALFYVIFPLGLLWSGVSGSNRSVQDLILRTTVVYDWRGARRSRPKAPPTHG